MTRFADLPDAERRAIENAYAEFTARMWQRIEQAPVLWSFAERELYVMAREEALQLWPILNRPDGVQRTAVNVACLAMLLWQRAKRKGEVNA